MEVYLATDVSAEKASPPHRPPRPAWKPVGEERRVLDRFESFLNLVLCSCESSDDFGSSLDSVPCEDSFEHLPETCDVVTR